jgi:glycerol-3-phosphate acyltransferase PlsY
MEIAGLYIYSYLVGSVPTAYLMGRLVKGVDIRGYGSGNVGGANIFRHVGKGWVVPLFVSEVLIKGASPVWIGEYLLGWEHSAALLIGAPLLAIAGNNWSVFLRFQGGRGIAVATGTLLGLSPFLMVAAIAIAVSGWAVTRSSGVWVLISLALLPFWAVLLGDPDMISLYCTGLLLLVAFKRLVSNWTPLPEDLPKSKVLFNRLFRDRDVDDRADWVYRMPRGTK